MLEIEKMVVASRNPAKVERFRKLLAGMVEGVVGLDELGIKEKPKETGETAEENAEIKARFYVSKVGLPVFSEDESLFVDFLPADKQPGVHVRRVNKRDEVNDDELLAYWEALVAAAPRNNRKGRWHIAYCLATPFGETHTVSLDHPIMFFSPSSKVRLRGWPMSSLQGSVTFGKPDGELTEEERRQKDERADGEIVRILKNLF